MTRTEKLKLLELRECALEACIRALEEKIEELKARPPSVTYVYHLPLQPLMPYYTPQCWPVDTPPFSYQGVGNAWVSGNFDDAVPQLNITAGGN